MRRPSRYKIPNNKTTFNNRIEPRDREGIGSPSLEGTFSPRGSS